jgi:hypothetical protein
MLWPHPSRRRLAAWAADPIDDRIEMHLEQCPRCVSLIEDSAADTEVPFGDILQSLLAAPADFEEELVERAGEARRNRAALDILGGLMAVPWETLRIMMDEGRAEDA